MLPGSLTRSSMSEAKFWTVCSVSDYGYVGVQATCSMGFLSCFFDLVYQFSTCCLLQTKYVKIICIFDNDPLNCDFCKYLLSLSFECTSLRERKYENRWVKFNVMLAPSRLVCLLQTLSLVTVFHICSVIEIMCWWNSKYVYEIIRVMMILIFI